MTETYNPIRERMDVPKRWFGTSVTAPELGTAHVLIPKEAAPVVLWHGYPLPQGKVGAHRRFIVDVARHGLSFDLQAASAEAVFPFAITVELACRVIDPLAIARDNIIDMTAALVPSLAREIRDTAARFDKLQPTEAARAIEARLGSAHPSREVELGNYSVTVKPVNTQGVVAAKQELTVQELRREGLKEVSHGKPEDLLAQLLATNNGDPREVLQYLSSERTTEAEIKLQALQIAMGGKLEDVDMADVHRNAFGNLFGAGTGNGGKQETMRERVERRTKPAIDAAQVVDAEVAAPTTTKKETADAAPKPAAEPASAKPDTGGSGSE